MAIREGRLGNLRFRDLFRKVFGTLDDNPHSGCYSALKARRQDLTWVLGKGGKRGANGGIPLMIDKKKTKEKQKVRRLAVLPVEFSALTGV